MSSVPWSSSASPWLCMSRHSRYHHNPRCLGCQGIALGGGSVARQRPVQVVAFVGETVVRRQLHVIRPPDAGRAECQRVVSRRGRTRRSTDRLSPASVGTSTFAFSMVPDSRSFTMIWLPGARPSFPEPSREHDWTVDERHDIGGAGEWLDAQASLADRHPPDPRPSTRA